MIGPLMDLVTQPLVNRLLQPPRAGSIYLDKNMWPAEFSLQDRTYQRHDLELKNARGYTLKCTHYLPSPFPQDTSPPCVVFCHPHGGSRFDANLPVMVLLPLNITVFTLDFSGSGLSDGDYVSFGWHEKDDIKTVVSYLRSNQQVSRIGLWGRSMGAVSSLLYGAEDPSIAAMVLDSPFSNLYDLMMEHKNPLPNSIVKIVVQSMRRVIAKKAKFDIMNVDCLRVASKTFIPVLFGHGTRDEFIQPYHCDLISEAYAGDKTVIKFVGNHISIRHKSFHDSVSIFFFNLLRPPHVSTPTKFTGFCDSQIISRSVPTDAASSSSALPTTSTTKSDSKLLSAVAPLNDVEPVLKEDNTVKAFAAPMRSMKEKSSDLKGGDDKTDKNNKKKKAQSNAKKPKSGRFEKLQALGGLMLHCLPSGSSHRRNKSS